MAEPIKPGQGLEILSELYRKPIAKMNLNTGVNVKFNDLQSTMSVNRSHLMDKLSGFNVVVDIRKPETARLELMTPPVLNPPPISNLAPPSMPSSITIAPSTTPAPMVEPETVPLDETTMVPPSIPAAVQDTTVAAPVVQPTIVSETAPLVQPTVDAPPAKTRAKQTKRLKIVDKTVAKINLEDATIDGRPVLDRLPKPEKMVMKAPSYYMQNRKLYMQKLNALFSEYNKEVLEENRTASCDTRGKTSGEVELMTHQRVIRDYLNLYTPYRGLLLYHGLGAGKTASSISIAEGMKSEKRVFVLTPASLKMNYFSELKKYGDPLFRKNQFWEFISTEGHPEYVDVLSYALSLPREFVLQNKGAWLVDVSKKTSNFKDLSAAEQTMLDEQLNFMIRTKYVDINYNGLTEAKYNDLTKNGTINPFDHSVVVIDEAHNLVSRIVNQLKNPNSLSFKLYQLFLSATDAKFVLLSGTPIINYPSELGVLFNILRGYITTWKITLPKSSGLNAADIVKIFDEADLRSYDYIDFTNNELTITRNPFGFVYVKKPGVEKGYTRAAPTASGKMPLKVPLDAPPTIVIQPNVPKKNVAFKSTPEVFSAPPQPASTPSIVDTMMSMVSSTSNAVAEKPEIVSSETKAADVADKSADVSVLPLNKEDTSSTPPTVPEPASVPPKVVVGTVNKQTPQSTMPLRLKTRKLIIKKPKPGETTEPAKNPEQDGGAGKKQTKKRNPKLASPIIVPGNDYYTLKNGIIELKTPAPEAGSEINETLEQEWNQLYDQKQNNEGLDSMQKGGMDVVFDRYNGVHLNEQGNISDEEFITRVIKVFQSKGIIISAGANNVVQETYKALPDKRDDFYNMFVSNDFTMKDVNVFKKRILGLTSYFRSAQESLLPTIVKTGDGNTFHIEKCPMSEHQLSKYEEYRARERAEEMQSEKKKSGDANTEDDAFQSSYRVYSRALCNFSLPSQIVRPEPSSFETEVSAESVLDNVYQENDNQPDVANDQPLPVVSQQYNLALQKTLDMLNTAKEVVVSEQTGEQTEVDVLSQTMLTKYSPKFHRILSNLTDPQNKGLHLIYSNFRTLEGIGIMKLVLEHNGFAQFKLEKKGKTWKIVDTDADLAKPRFVLYTGTESADEREMVRNVYNSNWDALPPELSEQLRQRAENNHLGNVIKIMMITASGAEGINLENTRFVHIVEPYWHMTRIEQVVGRARRICSHKNLPEELRTVKVFLYLSTYSEEQKKSKKHIDLMTKDTDDKKQPITTDEYLFLKAQKKDMLQKQFLKAVKETAIDCKLYNKFNTTDNLVCYGYGNVASNDFSSYPKLEQDKMQREELNVKTVTSEMKKAELPPGSGQFYAVDPASSKVYDLTAYQNNTLVLLGKIGKNEKGQFVLVPSKV